MDEAISRTVRKARHSLRLEVCVWQRAIAGLLVVSVMGNAALYGLLHYRETVHKSEANRLRAEIHMAERVRDDALRSYGALVRWVEQNGKAQMDQVAVVEDTDIYQYIGKCRITYYCPCEKCCGQWADGLTVTGIPATPGIVAVDPNIIPLGSTVVIDGVEYLAADTGGAVKGLHIDICVEDHTSALSLGTNTADVWVVA